MKKSPRGGPTHTTSEADRGVADTTDRPPSGSRRVVFAFASILLGSLLAFLVFESALHFMPVSSGLRLDRVNSEQPVAHLEADREFTYSRGWKFSNATPVRINNAGFVNDLEYVLESETPLLAVVGDSYVEAAMVPHHQTLQGRLAEQTRGTGRVYSFGISGAPLSQYLVWARHAVERYNAQGVTIVVVGNDFDESLIEYQSSPGFFRFADDGDGGLSLRLEPYDPPFVRRLAYSTATARYLVFNLQAHQTLGRFAALGERGSEQDVLEFVGNTDAGFSDKRMLDSQRAVEAFFDELSQRSGLPPERISFVLDGLRLYDPAARIAASESYFGHMRSYFARIADSRGYEVIDMDSVFVASFARDGRRFEFVGDRHWNSVGHELASRAVVRSRMFGAIFGPGNSN